MSRRAATVRKSDLKRQFEAWREVYGSEPVCRIHSDGTVELSPADHPEPEPELDPYDRWKAGHAQ